MIKKLKLFGQDWKIVYRDPDPILDHQFRGMTCYPQREIHLLTSETERSTMLHELIHVAGDTCGAKMTEEQVEALERGLWMIFEANPKLMEYFVYGNTSNEAVVSALCAAGADSERSAAHQRPSMCGSTLSEGSGD
jgi:hypothetical protein